MSGSGNGAIAGPLRMLFESGTAAGASDAELLDRFVQRGPGAEGAFSALLDRHGSMVLAVCRRLSGDSASADDAFQATWLALVRRSGSIRLRGSLAPWLFAVSRRIALRARRRADRLRPVGVPAPEPIALASTDDLAERADLIRTLLDEIARLPERYRAPLVLCHLESRTHDQAAGDLGWPVGTVRTRLSRGRRLLRDRLERRGVGLSIAAALDGLRREATAAIPPSLEAIVVRFASATLTMSGPIVGGLVPVTVADLSRGALNMAVHSLATPAMVGSFVVGILAAGIGVAALSTGPHSDDRHQPTTGTRSAEEPRGDHAEKPPDQGTDDPFRTFVRSFDPAPDEPISPSLPDGEPKDTRSPSAFQVDEDAEGLELPVEIKGPGITPRSILRDIEEQTGVTFAIDLESLDRPMSSRPTLGSLLDDPIETPFDRHRPGARYTIPYETAERILSGTLRDIGLEYREVGGVILIVRPGAPEPTGTVDEGESDDSVPTEISGSGRKRSSSGTPPQALLPEVSRKPVVSGGDQLAEEAVEPPRANIAGLLEPTIEEVEQLFVEKAYEAVEIESTIDAWERLKGVNIGERSPTEISQLLDQTRKKLEARLTEFAGEPDRAASELERLRAELKDLLALDVALVGPEGEAAQMLATQCVAQFTSQFPDNPVVEMGMQVNRPGQQRVYPFALRIQSLFARLGVEVGPPINYAGGGLRFGMSAGMGGGMGGGFQ